MNLETERLYIRRFKETDASDFYEYMSISEVVLYEPYEVFSKEDCMDEVKNRMNLDYFFAVCLKENDKLIGHLYFNQMKPVELDTYTLGYVFNPNYYHQGYATEACQEIMRYAFLERHAHRIFASCNVLNIASWKLLERLKMRREAHMLKKVFFKRDENNEPIWNDVYQYAMLKEEWLK